jgi:hypothetical protein
LAGAVGSGAAAASAESATQLVAAAQIQSPDFFANMRRPVSLNVI